MLAERSFYIQRDVYILTHTPRTILWCQRLSKGEGALVGNAPFFAVCFRYAGSCKMSLTRDRMNIKHLLSCPPVSHHDSDILSRLQSCATNRFLSQTTPLKYKLEKNLNGAFDNLRINAWYIAQCLTEASNSLRTQAVRGIRQPIHGHVLGQNIMIHL